MSVTAWKVVLYLLVAGVDGKYIGTTNKVALCQGSNHQLPSSQSCCGTGS